MSFALYRIPLLATTAVTMNQSFFRPNPAVPTQARRRPKDVLERLFVRFVSVITYLVSYVSYIPAFFDICMILHSSRDSIPAWVARYIDILPFQTSSAVHGVPLSMITGTATAVASAALRLWTMQTLGRYFTLELTVQPSHRLVTAGPYSIVRHPSYTTGLIIVLGAGLTFCAPGDGWIRAVWLPALASTELPLRIRVPLIAITLVVSCAFGLGIASAFSRPGEEDRMLKEHFGKDWDKWAACVPYKLFPGVF